MERFVVEHDSPLTAWGQVRRDLRRRIDDGEFAAGAKLPTEVELTAHYSVSRVTVRRAIAAMVDDRYVVSRRGSGTYVALRPLASRLNLDLALPWRQQIIALGHRAESLLVESVPDSALIPDVARFFDLQLASDDLLFAREVHLVDRVPIGVTESWTTSAHADTSPESQDLVAECFAQIGFATTVQAELLRSYLDIPLIVVHARTRSALNGELIEIARTSWLGNRVQLAYERTLTRAEIDVTGLLGSL